MATLNRDLSNTDTMVGKGPDLNNVLAKQADMMAAAQAAGEPVGRTVGDIADNKFKQAAGAQRMALQAFNANPSGDGHTLVQIVPAHVDPTLAAYIRGRTGGNESPYEWDDTTLGQSGQVPELRTGNPFRPASNGCVTAECAAGLGRQGRGLLPDYSSANSGSLSAHGAISVNLHDGATYIGAGVNHANPASISIRPGGMVTFGWIIGANSAHATNLFMRGDGNQAYISIPTPWGPNAFFAITHSYGGRTAIEAGLGTKGPVSFGYSPWSRTVSFDSSIRQ